MKVQKIKKIIKPSGPLFMIYQTPRSISRHLKIRKLKILKEAGAKEVHFRVASPEIKYPCYYGIDTPHKEELISNNMSKEEVCEYIEADSLEYLSVDDLVNAIGNDRDYALESFNGDYFVKE